MTYILKDPSAKVKTLIYFTYYFNARQLKLSTGEKILPRDWNSAKRRPRANAPMSATLTLFLDRFETRAKEIHLKMKADFVPITVNLLREAIIRDLRTGGKKENLTQFISNFIEESKETRKPGSLEVYKSVEKMLAGYHAAKDFDDINSKWFERFQAYMERGKYSANYIGKNVAIIKELMTIAKKRGLHRNLEYKDTDYKKPSESVETIYLTENELLTMYGIELSPAMDSIRNRFMIGAFTGLRFSDSAKITADSIREGLIFDRNIKTGGNVVIPIHWVVDQIFEFHPDGLPPSISNQKTNKFIKTIGRKAGITTPVVISKTIGGKIVTTTHAKCDLITTHTARRSAITNMILAGIPSQNIMPISGHRTEASFQKYVKMSQEENAISLIDHPYFSKL